ncbi:MAG: LacI family DNA-binding transcriptional regulator, partial [Acidobacteria bacterium]|nr:LacI family DNA-binding transcriptional regulator [Acidobacteriota bacterium]
MRPIIDTHPCLVPFRSIHEVAKRARVSTATVSRT